MRIWTVVSVSAAVTLLAVPLSLAQDSFAKINWGVTAARVPPCLESQTSPVVTSVSLQPGGSLIAVVGDDHALNIYDRSASAFQRQLSQHQDWVQTAEFSPDGQLLATAGNDGRLLLWDVHQWEQPRELAFHKAPIVDLSFSSDGALVAAVGFENTLRVYEVDSGVLVHEIGCPCRDMHAVAFSHDDQWLAAGGRNGVVSVWSVADAQQVERMQLHRQRIRALLFTADNRLITCGDDRIIRVTDVKAPELSRAFPVQGGKQFAMCLVRDELLATAGSDNHINIWSLPNMSLLGRLPGHTGSVTCLDSQDRTLISGSYDTHIRLWSTEKVAAGVNGSFRR